MVELGEVIEKINKKWGNGRRDWQNVKSDNFGVRKLRISAYKMVCVSSMT